MNEAFATRVRSAAIAGWWTILPGSLFLVLQWLASRMLLSAKPGWVLTLWGPSIAWATVGTIKWWIMAMLKMRLWLMTPVGIWLSLCDRRLKS